MYSSIEKCSFCLNEWEDSLLFDKVFHLVSCQHPEWRRRCGPIQGQEILSGVWFQRAGGDQEGRRPERHMSVEYEGQLVVGNLASPAALPSHFGVCTTVDRILHQACHKGRKLINWQISWHVMQSWQPSVYIPPILLSQQWDGEI